MVDKSQRVHITIHDPVVDGQNCTSNYRWHSTGEPRVRVAQKVEESSGGEAIFESLQPKEILYAASVNLKLEYGFYLLARRFQSLLTKQKISCFNISGFGNSDMPDTSLQAQYLTFAREETLYSLRCKKRNVYVAVDWET